MKFLLVLLLSVPAFAQEGFKLPKDWETTKAGYILEIKSSEQNIKNSFKQFCSHHAAKSMDTNRYIKMLAYQELTNLSCGDLN